MHVFSASGYGLVSTLARLITARAFLVVTKNANTARPSILVPAAFALSRQSITAGSLLRTARMRDQRRMSVGVSMCLGLAATSAATSADDVGSAGAAVACVVGIARACSFAPGAGGSGVASAGGAAVVACAGASGAVVAGSE